ncbi:glutamate racemase [Blattabacterium cuenoti]|uniref:glutamate racemase n=1 Tax=Blattabacterium cuenoti TaxID=1653831 RepID=UPI00163C7054|nr:glutamate racemase [Blattabacterium cuenoti]
MKYYFPIGIFDSGIGGLCIAKEIINYMPNERLFYVGDTKNMPYGNKSQHFIRHHSMKIVSFLFQHQCKAIVIACNSIVSNALDIIQEKFSQKTILFNVIDPVIKNKIFFSYNKIGICATHATIRSQYYQNKMKKHFPHLTIITKSIPFLAKIIENGIHTHQLNSLIQESFNSFIKNIDLLLLACTHYLFLKNAINNIFKENIRIIEIQKIVVKDIITTLYNKNLLNTVPIYPIPINNHHIIFYTSDFISPIFYAKVKSIFKNNFIVKQINL